MPNPRVSIGPDPSSFAAEAVREGGGVVGELGTDTEALVWMSVRDKDGLRRVLDGHPGIRWVQLPLAGVEGISSAGFFDDGRVWTCAKGSYAEPVAEHAVLLALAGLRHLPERVVAKSWGEPKGTSLYDAPVTILGGGGITRELLRLLAPWRVQATVVRRQPDPVPGAARTVAVADLFDALPGALVVFLALALTPATTHIIDKEALAVMDPAAWLVNVARGGHVDTDALVTALESGTIAGAALDVSEPEPLPDGHPLWSLPNCIITPHSADTPAMILEPLKRRIRDNVAHFSAGEPLEGLIDPTTGY